MHIDGSQRPWIVGTGAVGVVALGFYAVVDHFTLGMVRGGSVVGLTYGIIGSLLMIVAGLLAGHRHLPVRRWIGNRVLWLKIHIWLGLLSVVFILCHAGFRLGGKLEQLLLLVMAIVVFSGVYGLVMQRWLPQQITIHVPGEAPYHQLPRVIEKLRDEAETLCLAILDKLPKPSSSPGEQTGAKSTLLTNLLGMTRMMNQAMVSEFFQFSSFQDNEIRPFMALNPPGNSHLRNAAWQESTFAQLARLPNLNKLQDDLNLLKHLCDERRHWLDQERYYYWLHNWLIVHVPLTVILLVLGVWHGVVSLYY